MPETEVSSVTTKYFIMSEQNEDFLIRRLDNVMTVESNLNSQEAIAWKCWGRGGTCPPLDDYATKRFIDVYRRFNGCVVPKLPINNRFNSIYSKASDGDDITERISSECNSVFGKPTTDKQIAQWLKESFAYATASTTDDNDPTENSQASSHNAVMNGNKSIKQATHIEMEGVLSSTAENRTKKVKDKILCTSNNSDMEEENLTLKSLMEEDNSPFVDKQCVNNPSLGLLSSDKNIKCILNRQSHFLIQNLPLGVTRTYLLSILGSFGKVENILLIQGNGKVTASVRMCPECDCQWIVEYLDGYPLEAFLDSSNSSVDQDDSYR